MTFETRWGSNTDSNVLQVIHLNFNAISIDCA